MGEPGVVSELTGVGNSAARLDAMMARMKGKKRSAFTSGEVLFHKLALVAREEAQGRIQDSLERR
jgi:hypothetical protein